jgi:hypothetical protein
MLKIFLATVSVLLFFTSLAAAQNSAKKDAKLPKLSVELDKSKVTLACPPGQTSRSKSCDDSLVVFATVSAIEGTLEGVELDAIVSGGRIVSKKGAKFQWDLSGAFPAKYIISVYAVDEQGRAGEPVKQIAEVAKCESCGYIDSCPTISLDDPKPVAAGELMEFHLKVSSEPGDSLTFNWSLSDGTIESGQGTPNIKVRTAPNMARQVVTATVVIGNSRPGLACQDTATASGEVTAKRPK